MKKKFKLYLEGKSGITLIALVITIIVLLLLAGISISMLSGDNSILQKATDAKTYTNNEQIKEKVQLAYTAAIADGKGELTETNLRKELTNEFGENYDLNEDTSTNEWVISVNLIEILRVEKGEKAPVVTSILTDAEKTALQTNGIAEITGDDISNDNFKKNSRIKAVLTGNVPLTTEMTYITGTVNTGVVVSIDGNEFVWVPVPIAIASDASTISTLAIDLATNPSTNRPMAKLQSGSDTNYEGLLYHFNETTSIYPNTNNREPAYLTDSSNADASSYNTVGITQNSLQGEYNSMVSSVAKYGGFYVGRYELGLEGTNPVSKPASETVTTADASQDATKSWYGLYSKCKSYSVENLTSTMPWGSQYDAMMNWMAKTGNAVGTADDNKYNTEQTTGSKLEDIINNIYDLYGCHYEWTYDAFNNDSRVPRGGSYRTKRFTFSPWQHLS